MRERIGTINASFPVFQNTFHVLTRQLPTLFGVLFFLVLVEELFNISLFFLSLSCSEFTQQTKPAQTCFRQAKFRLCYYELVRVYRVYFETKENSARFML